MSNYQLEVGESPATLRVPPGMVLMPVQEFLARPELARIAPVGLVDGVVVIPAWAVLLANDLPACCVPPQQSPAE